MRDSRLTNLLAVVVVLSAGAALAAQQGAPSMRGDAPPPAAKPFSITRLDPALDAVVAPDTTAELIASGFGLNEGPVWVREGASG